MINTSITILDHGTPLTIDYEDCVKFHGRTNIGGVALGLRLMQYALAEIADGRPVERETIRVVTAFPGLGVKDSIEMISRAVTRNAYLIDATKAPHDAPAAVVGKLWFSISIGDQTRSYTLVDGAMNEEFFTLGRKSKTPQGLSTAEADRWQELKEALAITVMKSRAEDVLMKA